MVIVRTKEEVFKFISDILDSQLYLPDHNLLYRFPCQSTAVQSQCDLPHRQLRVVIVQAGEKGRAYHKFVRANKKY